MAISTRQVLQLRHLSASFGIAGGGLAVSNVVSNHGHGWTNRNVDQVLTGTIGRLDLVTKRIGLDESNSALTWGSNDYLGAATDVKLGVRALDGYLKSAAETRIGLVDGGSEFSAITYSSTNFVANSDTLVAAVGKVDTALNTEKGRIDTILASANVSADTFLEVYNAYSAISGATSNTYALRLNDAFGDVINSDGQWVAAAVNGSDAATYLTGSSLTTMLGDIDHLLAEVSGSAAALPVLHGVADRATNLGTFTGDIITNNSSIKTALQELEVDLDFAQDAIGVGAAANLGAIGSGNQIITSNGTVKVALQELEVDLVAAKSALGAGDAANLGSISGGNQIIAANGDVKGALTQLEVDLRSVQTLLGVAAETTAFATFDGDVIANNSTVSGALVALETRVDAIKSDFRAAHVSGSDGQVYAGYALGFGAGSPQMRMVKDHDGHVNVYFEIR